MSGYLRSLSARALGLDAAVKSATRLPYSAPPAILEQPIGDEPAAPLPAARVFSAAPLPNAGHQRAPSDAATFRDVPSLVPSRRGDDEGRERDPSRPAREPADQNPAAASSTVFTPPRAVEPARAPSVPPVLAATRFVLPPAFASASERGSPRATGAHRHSSADATEVHVTIGRIDVTAVHEPAAARRRPAPVKSTISLDDYLGKGRRARP